MQRSIKSSSAEMRPSTCAFGRWPSKASPSTHYPSPPALSPLLQPISPPLHAQTDGGADAFYNETVSSQVINADGTATLTLVSPVLISVFYYEWAPGNAVTVVQGPNVGQMRRLVDVIAPANTTIIVDAPFNPPLSPTEDIVAITSYRGGYTFE